MGQQRLQLLNAGVLAKGAAQNTDQTRLDVKGLTALTHALNDRFNDARDRQAMGHCHIAGGEAQLNIVQPVTCGIFHVLKRHATAGLQRGQHLDAPVQFCQEAHQIRFVSGHLDVRTQRFKRVGGQGKGKLTAKVKNGLRPDVAVKVAVNVGQREISVNHGCTLFLDKVQLIIQQFTTLPKKVTAQINLTVFCPPFLD